MLKENLHITEYYIQKNERNMRARKLLAEFLNLEESACKIPLRLCSQTLIRFVRNYNSQVKSNKKIQQSLFE